jgi:hypothetical protein
MAFLAGSKAQGSPQTHLVICRIVSEIGEFSESGVAVFIIRCTAA